MSPNVSTDNLATFLAGQRTKIGTAFTEIEQLQKEYQGAYAKFKSAHDSTLHALVDRFEGQNDGAGDALKRKVDARLAAERDIVVKRLAALDNTLLPHAQDQADALVVQAQQARAGLQKSNPEMNAREEQLKTDIAQWQQTLDGLNRQVEQDSRGLGFLLHLFRLRTLDQQRHQALGHLASLNEQLRKVRQDWVNLKQTVTKEESDWQVQWEAQMGQIAALRQERDYLAQNTEMETRHRAIFDVLDELKALPPGGDAAALQPMIDLNIQTDNFQAALGSVAGILGTIKGVDEGLARLNESVNALIAEQNRHSANLSPLTISIPDSAIAFGKTWDDLIVQSKDDKTLGAHPADYVAAMQPFLDKRLSQDRIVEFFTSLGNALTEATKNWRGT